MKTNHRQLGLRGGVRPGGTIQRVLKPATDKFNVYEWVSEGQKVRFQLHGSHFYERLDQLDEGTGDFYHYYEKADLMKSCPPPPSRLVISVNNNSPTTRPQISDELWHQLDATLVSDAYIGRLPSDLKDLLTGTLVVTKYVEASIGVYFISNGSTTFVVKPFLGPQLATSEYLASRIANHLGIPHPDTRFVDSDSTAGKLILDCLNGSLTFRRTNASKSGGQTPTHFLVMTEVVGVSLNKLVPSTISDNNNNPSGHNNESTALLRSLVGDKAQLAAVLRHIGQIAAFDIFLFYDDRTGAFVPSDMTAANWGNIMVTRQGNQVTGLAVIDQSVGVEYSKTSGLKPPSPPSLFQATEDDDDPLFGPSKPKTPAPTIEKPKKQKRGIEEIKQEVRKLVQLDHSFARNIWMELPNDLRQILFEDLFDSNKATALRQITKSIVEGLNLLTYRVTDTVLNHLFLDLQMELGTSIAKKTQDGLLKSLKIIKKGIG